MIASVPPVYPWPIGPGPRYRPAAANVAVLEGRPVGSLRCSKGGRYFAVHVELFADRRVVVVPRWIGVAWSGCRYPLSTSVPTGVVDVSLGRRYTLGDLFRIWGRPFSQSRLVSFHGPVRVYVGGRRFTGDPRSVPLTRHAQIVIELGRFVPPHVSYVFPKGAG